MSEARAKAQLAKKAAQTLNHASSEVRNNAVNAMADALDAHMDKILAANAQDVANAEAKGTPAPLVDRLLLTKDRVHAMAEALRDIARQEDPIGEVVGGSVLPNGIAISQVRVPLGVVAMIYEARPNVTADAAGLCIKTGNAVVLRGGSLANQSNIALTEVLAQAAESAGLPAGSIVSIESTDREESNNLMQLTGLIDVLIPRGGASLIKNCVENSKVPVIETGTGNCHIYVERTANPDQVVPIVLNAKVQRPGVCNAAESLLIDKDVAPELLPAIGKALAEKGVALVGDELACQLLSGVAECGAATQEDYATEFLDLKISIRCVDDYKQAVEHINTYGTGHSEAILTESYTASEYFLNNVDAAALYVNASTRFTDGGVYGLGAEIGISTQKLHARGPMGAKVLTSTKYICRGSGQIRA